MQNQRKSTVDAERDSKGEKPGVVVEGGPDFREKEMRGDGVEEAGDAGGDACEESGDGDGVDAGGVEIWAVFGVEACEIETGFANPKVVGDENSTDSAQECGIGDEPGEDV